MENCIGLVAVSMFKPSTLWFTLKNMNIETGGKSSWRLITRRRPPLLVFSVQYLAFFLMLLCLENKTASALTFKGPSVERRSQPSVVCWASVIDLGLVSVPVY
jgi:hypothetical protein